MKKYNIYTILLSFAIVLTMVQCSNEDEPEPSNLDINWYELQDSSDPLDHLRFSIYQTTGVPIYYNDTIGSQERGEDAFGNNIIYYEVIDCSYSITSNTTVTWITLPKVRDDIHEAVEMIRDDVLPNIPASMRPRSYLLVDSLIRRGDSNSYKYQDYTYKALMTTVVGELYEWSSIDKKNLAARIIAEEVASFIVTKSDLDLTNFYTVSMVNDKSLYNQEVRTGSADYPYKSWMEYGFLTYYKGASYSADKNYKCVSQATDVFNYLTECYYSKLTNRSPNDFDTQYAGYPLIIEKYHLMDSALEELLLSLE